MTTIESLIYFCYLRGLVPYPFSYLAVVRITLILVQCRNNILWTLFIVALLVLMTVSAAISCDPFPTMRNTRVKFPKDLTASELAYHESYMQIAYDLAVQENNLFTTVIVAPNGTIACVGLNQNDISAINHGETVAIRNCSIIHGKNTWAGYSLYTTGESCPMCHAAAMWAQFDKVIYGKVKSTSIEKLYCSKCLGQIPILSETINAGGFGLSGNYRGPQIIGDILASKTDTIYPDLCGTTGGWAVNPLCKRCSH
eukprot:gene15864-18850_t